MFDDLTREEAVQAGAKLLEEDKFHYVVTPNPEFILAAGKDEEFRRVLNSADLVLADGIGVVYSAKIKGTPLKGRVPGIEFAADMLSCLSQRGGRLYLLGAKPGVAELAAANLKDAHPGLIVCGTHDGSFREDGPVVEEIRAAAADVGIAGGKGEGLLFAKGVILRKVPQEQLVDALMEEIGRL